MQSHGVWVVALDARGDLGLPLEALPAALVGHQHRVHQLEGPLALGPQLLDHVDRAHPALGERTHHLELLREDRAFA
jgi:hypothetical protein